ncbi:hypothetical protein AB0E74_25770 [Streptomyces sp. NPDC030392]|uniref:hypothetical protein n=1 Tax=Streptomyces sp. NPDC030392 TaxID=3155468 RepID=UPI00340BD894
MNVVRRIGATLGCLTLGAAGVFLTAPAAQADVNACVQYLESQGYQVNSDHFFACYVAKDDWSLCYYTLTDEYVHPAVAARACDYGRA